MIVDASVILCAFFPEEHQSRAHALIRDHLTGQLRLLAPTLLLYEVTNGVVQAVRRERITHEEAESVMADVAALDIGLEPVDWPRVMRLAHRYGRTAYDAAYLALAEARDEPLVTADLRLFRSVRDHLHWVQWIGDR